MREARQRAELCEVTARMAAEVGFEATKIYLAAPKAGLGLGTYYKLYESKEACLAEAFERCAEAIFRRVEEAMRAEANFAQRVAAGLSELLDVLVAEPDVARVLLVEIRAGEGECRDAHERWLGRFARLLVEADRGDAAPRDGCQARLTAGALATLLAVGLLENGAEALPEMLEELVYVGLWARSGAEAAAFKGAEQPVRDTKGPAASASKGKAAARRSTQRQRLLGAMTDVVGEKGYKATRVTDVLERSALSRPVFYAHFGSKEDCLLAAFDAASEPILERVKAVVASATTSAGRAEAGLRVLVETLAAEPAIARLATIEIRASGPSGEERYGEALARFADLIGEPGADRQGGTASDIPRVVSATVASMIAREVGEGRGERLESLLPELVFTALAPCVGGERAMEEARAMSGPQPR